MTKEQIKQEILTKDLSQYINKPTIDLDTDIAAEYYNRGVKNALLEIEFVPDGQDAKDHIEKLLIQE